MIDPKMLTLKLIMEGVGNHPKGSDIPFKRRLTREGRNAIEETIAQLIAKPHLTKNKTFDTVIDEIVTGELNYLKRAPKGNCKDLNLRREHTQWAMTGQLKHGTLFGQKDPILDVPEISLIYFRYRFYHQHGVPPYNERKVKPYLSELEHINRRNNVYCCPKCGHIFEQL